MSSGPVRIDPSVHHAVLPWQGDRIVLVAYMPSFADRLSIADRSSLSELGFVFRNINASATAVLHNVRRVSQDPPHSPTISQVPLILELCAGHAVLSAVAEGLGFQSLPIDSNLARAPGRRLLRLDLADADNIDYLQELLQSEAGRIALVFISLPSGTASWQAHRQVGSPGLSVAFSPSEFGLPRYATRALWVRPSEGRRS